MAVWAFGRSAVRPSGRSAERSFDRSAKRPFGRMADWQFRFEAIYSEVSLYDFMQLGIVRGLQMRGCVRALKHSSAGELERLSA